jgi:C1A family cysteine protease
LALAALVGMIVVSEAAPLTSQQHEFLFGRFAEEYDKKYELSQFFTKYNTFKNNLEHILAHNSKPGTSYKLAMNEFGDLTQEEFKEKMLKTKPLNNYYMRSLNEIDVDHVTLKDDEAFDWRDKGGVNPVQNQGQCGSCWAFSAMASVEGAHFAKNKELVKVSEQQLVDCAGSYGNSGCQGGLMDHAFEYIIAKGGICKEEDYKYVGKGSQCRASKCSPAVRLTGFKTVKPMNETSLAKALKMAPVAIAIEASKLAFQFYSSGVFDGECGTQLDHGVAVVAMGKTDEGIPYWVVRNSWGAAWGESGYIRMIRGKNKCGLAQMPSIAEAA